MMRDIVRWCCAAIPAAGVLVAVGAAILSWLGDSTHPFDASQLPLALGILLFQSVAPIVFWVALTTWFAGLRQHLLLEILLFPLAVAAVGWIATVALGDPFWPRRGDAWVLSVLGWLGFSWTLLAARAIADHLLTHRN